ncbi:MAG: urocanate hydratase [Xanthobacteraceae bacterium]|nr:urocanate hydratase [Xanthobacteraceae bacterium]
MRLVVKITAQRGTQLRCKNWRAETLLRLLENNLENGENPDELVIYMSRAKAARDWKSFDQIVAALKNLEADETLIVQSGKPIGAFRTHSRAPMVIMANGNVVGRWASDENFLKYEQQGLTILPGMTAAAWQYIGSQGILQGTYQSFAAAGRRYFGGTLAGRVILTAGCGGMSGAQPLAGKMAGAATLVVEVESAKIKRRVDQGFCDRMTDKIEEALQWIAQAKAAGEGASVGLVGNVAAVYPRLLELGFAPDILTDQCMVDPYRGYVPLGMNAAEAAALSKSDPQTLRKKSEDTLRVHVNAILDFKKRGALTFEYGNSLRLRAADAGIPEALNLDSFVTLFIRPLFCEGIGPFRWIAVSGDASDIHRIDDIILNTFPSDHPIAQWIPLAQKYAPFQGLPARIGWLGHTERSRLALLVNEAVARKKISAPVAFTRDHLDAGSVANPFRETEKMKDGSDAISDWPLLNAMLSCSNGADLVAVHSNTDKLQSAGQTVVADGTPEAADRLKCALDGDTGIGVLRHADAGYETAIKMKDDHGLGI